MIEEQLRGKTLRVYVYLLKHERVTGPSQIQRDLGFSSPSLVLHHIDKLIGMGIVERNSEGGFSLRREVDIGVLRPFVNFNHMVLPRLGFYAGLFTGLTGFYLASSWTSNNPYGLVISIGACLALWYESIRTWKGRPN